MSKYRLHLKKMFEFVHDTAEFDLEFSFSTISGAICFVQMFIEHYCDEVDKINFTITKEEI